MYAFVRNAKRGSIYFLNFLPELARCLMASPAQSLLTLSMWVVSILPAPKAVAAGDQTCLLYKYIPTARERSRIVSTILFESHSNSGSAKVTVSL